MTEATPPAGRGRHTPGEWRVETRPNNNGLCIIAHYKIHASDAMYCVASMNYCRTPEDEANAHLLSAAPDLLEAAKMARRALNESADGTRGRWAFEALCAAIDKAERAAITAALGETTENK